MQTLRKNVTSKDLAVWLKQGMTLEELFQKLQSYSNFPLCSEDDLKSFLKKALKKSNVDGYIRDFKKNKIKLSPKKKNLKTNSNLVFPTPQNQQCNQHQEIEQTECDASIISEMQIHETEDTLLKTESPDTTSQGTNENFSTVKTLKENLEANMTNKQKTDERAEKLFSLNELLRFEETLKRNIINITEHELLPKLHELEKENTELRSALKNNLSRMETVLNELEGYKKSLEQHDSEILELQNCIKSLTEVSYTFFSCNARKNVLSFEDIEISKNEFEDSYLELLTEGVDKDFLDKLNLSEIKILSKAIAILKNKINEVEKITIFIFSIKEDLISQRIESYFPNIEFCYVETFEEP